MTARQFVYRTLVTTPEVTDLIGGDNPRVFAKKSMTSSREDHPFIVYKLGNSTATGVTGEDEDLDDIDNQFVQIWVHDFANAEVSDYTLIDTVLAAIKVAFKNSSSEQDGVFGVQYLETSQDFNDETLSTVFKYARYQLKKKGQ